MPRTTNNKPPPWAKSKAKQLLREDIIAGIVNPEMNAAAVFLLRPEFQLYKLTNFRTNLKNLREAIASGRGGPKPVPWGKSEAKRLLRADIITGVVKPEMDAAVVFQMRIEYQDYKLNHFRTNLGNLREVIEKHHGRMKEDVAHYIQDRKLLKEIRKNDPPLILWHQSEARKLLKIDIDNKKHTTMKPSQLYISRQEYQEFAPDVFRKHIHQEVTERASKAHRFEKNKLRPRGPAPPPPTAIDY